MCQKPASLRDQAFTLVELLVVIAIIALLAAMLLPALARARQLAETAECKNNLRQWAVGLQLYLAENDGEYPGYFMRRDDSPLSPTLAWYEALERHTGGLWAVEEQQRDPATWPSLRGVHVCPWYFRHKGLYGNRGSYGYNVSGAYGGGLGGRNLTHDLWRPTREPEVRSPAAMLAISDALLHFVQPDYSPAPSLWGDTFISPFSPGAKPFQVPAFAGELSAGALEDARQARRRHNSKWNVLYCDGHVENLKSTDLFHTTRTTSRQRWNADNQPYSSIPY